MPLQETHGMFLSQTPLHKVKWPSIQLPGSIALYCSLDCYEDIKPLRDSMAFLHADRTLIVPYTNITYNPFCYEPIPRLQTEWMEQIDCEDIILRARNIPACCRHKSEASSSNMTWWSASRIPWAKRTLCPADMKEIHPQSSTDIKQPAYMYNPWLCIKMWSTKPVVRKLDAIEQNCI